MLQAMGHSSITGQTWVLIGLGADNLKRLRESQPVRLNLQSLAPDLPNIDVIIAFDDGHLEELLNQRRQTKS